MDSRRTPNEIVKVVKAFMSHSLSFVIIFFVNKTSIRPRMRLWEVIGTERPSIQFLLFAKSELSKPIKQADNHFSGELIILIDGSNFSTTGHFCSLVKYHEQGTFIGIETGSTYTCNAAVRVIPLKNTRIGLKIATGSFAAAVNGFPKDRGIIPDHIVETKLKDLKSGKDTVLDYALELIESMN